MNKTTYIIMAVLTLSITILFYKLYSVNTSFEKYIYESKKPLNIYQCLKINCFINEFLKYDTLNTKKSW